MNTASASSLQQMQEQKQDKGSLTKKDFVINFKMLARFVKLQGL